MTLAAQVAAWIADDPDPQTAAELASLSREAAAGDAGAAAELSARFAGPLEFGTAGLRGAIGAGPHRMNRAVVIRAAAGLAAYASARLPADTPARVVIGYDARTLSDRFALDTASVMTGAGHEALVLPRALPTPLLAFAVRRLHADVGVMVTASHNPRGDNGFKVYLGGRLADDEARGAQIASPEDQRISELIARVGAVAEVPRPEHGWTTLGDDVATDYVAALVAATPAASGAGMRERIRIALTPLHGVGGATAVSALAAAGFTDVRVVPEQGTPDAAFPTVTFPNPEEPGVMAAVIALAEAAEAHVAFALDPDADRLAIATLIEGRWTTLHGDRVGCLLAERFATRAAGDGHPHATLANSIVSSRLLAVIAARHGLPFRATLTGFKWLARVPGLGFGYEEALGYCLHPEIVRDKDGISAAVAIADLVASLATTGRSLADALDDLDRDYGVYRSRLVSLRLASSETAADAMMRATAAPPARIAGSAVTEVDDLAAGVDGLPPASGMRLLTADGSRVVIRPSGTEPLVKAYVEVVVPAGPDLPDLPEAQRTAEARLDALAAAVHELITG